MPASNPSLLRRAASRSLEAAVVRSAELDGIVSARTRALARALDAAAAALIRQERVGQKRVPSPGAEILDDGFRDVLAAICAARGGYIYPYLSGIGFDGPERRLDERHECGGAMFVAETGRELFADYRRRVWICARCGFVGESPDMACLPKVTVTHGTARVAQPGVSGSVAVAVVLEPIGPALAEILLRGRYAAPDLLRGVAFPLPGRRDHGGVRMLAIATVADGDFLVARQRIGQT